MRLAASPAARRARPARFLPGAARRDLGRMPAAGRPRGFLEHARDGEWNDPRAAFDPDRRERSRRRRRGALRACGLSPLLFARRLLDGAAHPARGDRCAVRARAGVVARRARRIDDRHRRMAQDQSQGTDPGLGAGARFGWRRARASDRSAEDPRLSRRPSPGSRAPASRPGRRRAVSRMDELAVGQRPCHGLTARSGGLSGSAPTNRLSPRSATRAAATSSTNMPISKPCSATAAHGPFPSATGSSIPTFSSSSSGASASASTCGAPARPGAPSHRPPASAAREVRRALDSEGVNIA